MGGVAPHTNPVRAHPPSLGAICAASWRVGAGSLVLRGPRGSRWLGRGGGSRFGSSLGRGGDHPPCLGGWGPGPPRLAGRWGGGGGGSCRGLPAPLLGGGLRYSILAPLVLSARSLPACACGRGRSAARGWGGGSRGGPWTAPPGAPADLNPPSALPEWAVVTGGSCGARPPYCSVARVAPARWCGLAPRPRPPREQVQLHPPPPASRSFLGGGGPPLGSGGAEGRACGSLAGGGAGGGGWGGRPPTPSPRRASACLPLPPACPLGVYSCRGGCRAAAGVGRGPVGRRRVSAAGGGGGEGGKTPPPWFAPPSSPGRPLIRPLRSRRPGRRRSAVGRRQAGRVGACLGRSAPAPRVQRPL